MLYLSSEVEEIQDRCCYSEETSSWIYGSSTNLKSESVNSTICTNSDSWAPYLRCSTELTSFFNNNSFLYRTGTVSCYYLSPTPSKEDINCFFSGSSCSGSYPIAHNSNNANCVLTKFNFVNNTDSGGYFWLSYGNHKRVKESVIVFKSTDTLRWVYGYHSGGYAVDRGEFCDCIWCDRRRWEGHTHIRNHHHHSPTNPHTIPLTPTSLPVQLLRLPRLTTLLLSILTHHKTILPALILILSTLLAPN